MLARASAHFSAHGARPANADGAPSPLPPRPRHDRSRVCGRGWAHPRPLPRRDGCAAVSSALADAARRAPLAGSSAAPLRAAPSGASDGFGAHADLRARMLAGEAALGGRHGETSGRHEAALLTEVISRARVRVRACVRACACVCCFCLRASLCAFVRATLCVCLCVCACVCV
jgi:hypothetical protein